MIQVINGREVSIIRYRAGIVEWSKNELEAIDKETRKDKARKLLTMSRSFHPRSVIDSL